VWNGLPLFFSWMRRTKLYRDLPTHSRKGPFSLVLLLYS
jgi:hypothetical protein